MLVLSRHTSERIIFDLGDGRIISVMPIDLRGDKVRLGIDAPMSVKIYREEVYEQILAGEAHTEQELTPAA